MMRLYVYPRAESGVRFIAATSLRVAQDWHPKARVATKEEVSAALVDAVMIPAEGVRKNSTYARVEDFVTAA